MKDEVQTEDSRIHPSSLMPHPSSYWTHRLLAAGFTIDECAAIRGLSPEVVLEHVGQAVPDMIE